MKDLFEHAQEKRAEGIARSAISSGKAWQDMAIEFLRDYLSRHETLFCDDLWDAGLPEPASPRALGAVIQHAQKARWIEEITVKGGGVVAKPSVRSNMQLKRIWRSRLHVA